MLTKLLERIVEDIAGKSASKIVGLLAGKKDVNEFLIAKKLGLTINQVRNILYKLSDFGMISFIRKKDKRKGWYIYFWTLDIFKSLEVLEKKLVQERDILEGQLKSRQTKRFYVCKTCAVELTEESALNHFFTCPECGNVYELMDNEKALKEMRSQISRLEGDLEIIRTEKAKEYDKTSKVRRRVIKRRDKADKKEKMEKRKAAKKKREIEKALAEKNSPKKKSTKKKKPVKKTKKKVIRNKKKKRI